MFTKLDGVSPVFVLPDQIGGALLVSPHGVLHLPHHPHSVSFIKSFPNSSLTRTLHRALDALAAPPTNANNIYHSATNTPLSRSYHLSCDFHSHMTLIASLRSENEQNLSPQ